MLQHFFHKHDKQPCIMLIVLSMGTSINKPLLIQLQEYAQLIISSVLDIQKASRKGGTVRTHQSPPHPQTVSWFSLSLVTEHYTRLQTFPFTHTLHLNLDASEPWCFMTILIDTSNTCGMSSYEISAYTVCIISGRTCPSVFNHAWQTHLWWWHRME